MVKHEYKSLNMPIKKGYLSGVSMTPLASIEKILNEEGATGWRLIQIFIPDTLTSWGKATENMVALFERRVA